MNITNNLHIYCKSMGKIFRVTHIATSEEDANNYCAKHADTGVIAVDREAGLVFIAELYSITVPSNVLPD